MKSEIPVGKCSSVMSGRSAIRKAQVRLLRPEASAHSLSTGPGGGPPPDGLAAVGLHPGAAEFLSRPARLQGCALALQGGSRPHPHSPSPGSWWNFLASFPCIGFQLRFPKCPTPAELGPAAPLARCPDTQSRLCCLGRGSCDRPAPAPAWYLRGRRNILPVFLTIDSTPGSSLTSQRSGWSLRVAWPRVMAQKWLLLCWCHSEITSGHGEAQTCRGCHPPTQFPLPLARACPCVSVTHGDTDNWPVCGIWNSSLQEHLEAVDTGSLHLLSCSVSQLHHGLWEDVPRPFPCACFRCLPVTSLS